MMHFGLYKFGKRIAPLSIYLAAMLTAQNSFARAELYLTAHGSPALGAGTYSGFEVAENSKTVTQKNGPGYASGSGNLNTGTLKASAFGFGGYGSNSTGYIGDNVIFNGGIGQFGYLDYYVHGARVYDLK